MIRLLNIELKKIITYRMFWVMAGMYLLALFFLFYGFPSLIDYFTLKSNSPEIKLLKNFLYNFPDIWQNLSWIASLRFFVKVIPGIIVIMLVTNEYTYGTIRQNIINGLSREEFLATKVLVSFFFSLFSATFILIAGFVLGFSFSSVTTVQAIFAKMPFLAGYLVEIFVFLLFSMMIGLLVKKTSFSLSLLIVYPIVEIIVQQKLNESIHPFLPMNAMNHILRTPNTSLIQFKSPDFNVDLQTHLFTQDFLVAVAYGLLFIFISYLVLKKRDL